jgi:hypothetical protein
MDDLGYCGHCHWAVLAELEDGFLRFRQYLRRWAEFEAWCRSQGLAA